jgi:hypothetical protein
MSIFPRSPVWSLGVVFDLEGVLRGAPVAWESEATLVGGGVGTW